MVQEIQGILTRVIFENSDKTFFVAEFVDAQTARRFKATGKFDLPRNENNKTRYRLNGEWQDHPKHGRAFQTIFADFARPTSLQGLVSFLATQVGGVGEKTLNKLINHFKIETSEQLIDICKTQEDKIFAFFKKKQLAERIVFAVIGDETYRNIMMYLHENDISSSLAQRIYEKYKTKAIEILRANPYRLIADFRYVGFQKADLIARKVGIPFDSIERSEAAIAHALECAQDDGHCALPMETLITKTLELLDWDGPIPEQRQNLLSHLRQLYKNHTLKPAERSFDIRKMKSKKTNENFPQPDETYFYLPETLFKENEVASILNALTTGKHHIKETPLEKEKLKPFEKGEKTLQDIFSKVQWNKLSPEQKKAVEISVTEPIMILTGGPGCGKTFVLKEIFQAQKNLQRKVGLCAPTGLAAKRMSLAIGQKACTLHRLLGIGATEDHSNIHGDDEEEDSEQIEKSKSQKDPLEKYDMIIIDESSMLNLELMHLLLKTAGKSKRLIFVGDVDQLPSIGAGNCLRDMIASQRIPVVRLTKIFRQAEESPIPHASKKILEGSLPEFHLIAQDAYWNEPSQLVFLPSTPEKFFEHLITMMNKTIPQIYGLDVMKDCQILVPMRKTSVGQESINSVLQNILNPNSSDGSSAIVLNDYDKENKIYLYPGDKVMQVKNNYELKVFNGDMGFCKSIEKKSDKEYEVKIEYGDENVVYEKNQIADVQLSYGMTIHKSQGSEFPLCIIPLFRNFFTMLDRNLLYTAITRASKYVIVMGDMWALEKAIVTQNAINRHTALKELLQEKE